MLNKKISRSIVGVDFFHKNVTVAFLAAAIGKSEPEKAAARCEKKGNTLQHFTSKLISAIAIANLEQTLQLQVVCSLYTTLCNVLAEFPCPRHPLCTTGNALRPCNKPPNGKQTIRDSGDRERCHAVAILGHRSREFVRVNTLETKIQCNGYTEYQITKSRFTACTNFLSGPWYVLHFWPRDCYQ